MLTNYYYAFQIKVNISQYIVVNGLDYGEIPKFVKQSTSLFTFLPSNSDVICEHRFKTFTPNKPKIVKKTNGHFYYYYWQI